MLKFATYTFDEVLRRLNINEGKLKRLVSEGEIRAYREGDQMLFRRTDVENLDVLSPAPQETTAATPKPAKRPTGGCLISLAIAAIVFGGLVVIVIATVVAI